MTKIIAVCLLVMVASFIKPAADRTFTGFFARLMPIDSTSANCGTNTYGLLYVFQSDSSRSATNKTFLYGLLKCPDTLNSNLLNYNNRVRVYYRECTREDARNVVILNRHRYFDVRYYLITGLEEAD
ncbi:MAG TPA: hypothetical protein VD996_17175 [Chitinophagaceae bacterium]|nr:hypothetical protein [Chitinophagaceae bacterium]